MAAPEIFKTETTGELALLLKIHGGLSYDDLNKMSQEIISAIYEFNEKQHRATPPRLKLFFSNMYVRCCCAITGKEFEGGNVEYVLDEQLRDEEQRHPAVHPDFVKEADPALYEAGETLRQFHDRLMHTPQPWDEGYRKFNFERLSRVLDRIIQKELYRTVKPEALKQRLELLFKDVPMRPLHVPDYIPVVDELDF